MSSSGFARQPRSRWWRLAWLAPVVGAAALTIAVVAWAPRPPVVRAKGGARVTVTCQERDVIWRCRNGERLRPGATILIDVDLGAEREILLLGRTGAGWRNHLDRRDGGQGSLRLARGRHRLPQPLALEPGPGPQRFYVVDSAEPLSAWTAVTAVERDSFGPGVGVTELTFSSR